MCSTSGLDLTKIQMIVIGSIVQSCSYATQTYAPSFPLFVLSFLISGIGLAIQVMSSHEILIVRLKLKENRK